MIRAEDVELVNAAVAAAGRSWLIRVEGTGISIRRADGRSLARLRCLGEAGWEVRRPTATSWTHIGDFGGEAYEELGDAINYVLADPMGVLGSGSVR